MQQESVGMKLNMKIKWLFGELIQKVGFSRDEKEPK